MSKLRTIIEGDNATARRVVQAATGVTADPSSGGQGYALQGADWMHVFVRFNGGASAAEITPWYFCSVNGLWYEGDQLTFDPTNGYFAIVELRGLERVFFVVDSVTGAGSVDVWGAYSFDAGPERD